MNNLTQEWLFALLGANLTVGILIGWIARSFVPGAVAEPEPLTTPEPASTEDSESLLAEISQHTSSCTEQMRRFGDQLETADADGQSDLIEQIRESGSKYEAALSQDVARVSSLTTNGDAVLKQVLIELVKHSGHVTRFTKTLNGDVAAQIPGNVRDVLSVAISELVASNRKLEGELHSARREIEVQRDRLAEVQQEARIDALTRIANRRFFTERHESIHARFERGQDGYAVAALDLDHFKALNDTYGHAAGDAALRVFARILEDCVRKYDLPARVGGEEFAVLLDAAGQKEAMIVAERIRARTASVKVRYRGQEIHFTTSIGVAVVSAGETIDQLMRRADEALYTAKNSGRDRVTFSSDSDAEVDAETPELAPAV